MSKQDGKLTGLFGAPVSDRENSMTAGQRGPLLMQDVQVHLVRSQLQMTSHNIQMRKYSQKSENKQRCLHVFLLFQENVEQQI